MNRFMTGEQEKLLFQVVRAYVGEWGPDHVIISVPQAWSPHAIEPACHEQGSAGSECEPGLPKIEFSTEWSILVMAEHDLTRLEFRLDLQ